MKTHGAFLVCLMATTAVVAQTQAVRNIPYADARPLLEILREDLLPAEIRGTSIAERERRWPTWVKRRDAEIRARLARGDEDSLVNLILFGTSFTMHPRATERQIATLGGPTSRAAGTLVTGRIDDLVAGILQPGTNERLQFARQIVESRGIMPAGPDGRRHVTQYVIETMTRVAGESDDYDRAVASLEELSDPGARLAALATLFHERGLSSDTSIFPNFAIEEALAAVKDKGLLAAGGVRRIAIVGPGLDFVDKGSGYDFYPQQTIQPFGVVDSLLRLGLATPDRLRTTTFDLSLRVNQHLDAARQRARAGTPYVVHLPRDRDAPWQPGLVAYWEHFGDRIGEEVNATPPPAGLGNVSVRAVRVRPVTITSTMPQDLNVVLQRLAPLAPDERFDLVIATNILVYYDVFEQSLALANIASMLRPGGLFLTNDLLVMLPATPLTPIGSNEVSYTESSGSRMDWYRR